MFIRGVAPRILRGREADLVSASVNVGGCTWRESLSLRKQLSRRLNKIIDEALLDGPDCLIDELRSLTGFGDTEAIADRVLRRATKLARSHRARTAAILAARDQLVLRLYGAAAPPETCSGWADGATARRGGCCTSGIGAVLMAPGAGTIVELARRSGAKQSFDTEMEALIALLRTSFAHGARRIVVHTDCKALLQRWSRRRDDPTLQELSSIVGHYEFFKLKAVPRRHNQVAHRLAQAAMRMERNRDGNA
jgi:ribonuclease HI